MVLKQNKLLYLILLIFIASVLRLAYLSADPPQDFDPGFIFDEGWWIHNSRNKAVYNEFIRDDFNQSLFLGYPYALLTTLCFKLGGVSFFTMRLTSALLGILIVLLSFYYFRDKLRVAWGLSIVLALSYYTVSFSRVALTDIIMLFFLMLGFLPLFTRHESGYLGYLLCGASWGLALASKPYAFPLILGFALVLFFKEGLKGYKKIVFLIIGIALPLVIGFLLFIKPNMESFRMLYDRYKDSNAPPGILQGLRNSFEFSYHFDDKGITYARFVVLAPFIFALGLLGGARLVYKNLFPVKENIFNWGILAWLVLGIAFLSPMSYKPDRRYVLFLFPLVYLFINLINDNGEAYMQPHWIQRLISALFIAFPIAAFIFPFLAGLTGYSFTLFHGRTVAALLFIILILPLFLLVYIYLDRIMSFSFKGLRLIILFMFIFINAVLHISYFSQLDYSVYNLSRDLPSLLGKEDFVLLGGPVDLLVLENKGFGVTPFFAKDLLQTNIDIEGLYKLKRGLNPLPKGMNIPFAKFKPDYAVELVRVDYNEFPLWARSPWSWYKPVAFRFPLCRSRIVLEFYRLN